MTSHNPVELGKEEYGVILLTFHSAAKFLHPLLGTLPQVSMVRSDTLIMNSHMNPTLEPRGKLRGAYWTRVLL